MTPAAVASGECCEICIAPIGEEHAHLVDLRDRRLLCACRACYLLFVPRGAAQGRYRAVGERFERIDARAFEGEGWEALQIPIGLAFFFRNGATQRIAAFYPGPAGATESQLSLEAWNGLAAQVPQLAAMEADVEALLVDRERGQPVRAFLVPIDVCYELAGMVRTSWDGVGGGERARAALHRFFARIEERCA